MNKPSFFTIRLFNIDWDVDEDGTPIYLPKEMTILDRYAISDYTDQDGDVDINALLNDASDYISDYYGFCHRGFSAKIYSGKTLIFTDL